MEPPAGYQYRISPKKWGIFHPENVILVHNPAGGFANSDFKNAVILLNGFDYLRKKMYNQFGHTINKLRH
jgi:hypothetical protein